MEFCVTVDINPILDFPSNGFLKREKNYQDIIKDVMVSPAQPIPIRVCLKFFHHSLLKNFQSKCD